MEGSRIRRRDLALDHAPTVLQIAQVAADVAPVPCLGSVIGILSSILRQVEEVRNNSENAEKFLEKARALDAVVADTLREASDTPGTPGSTALQGRLEKLLSVLVEVRVSAGELKGRPGLGGSLKGVIYAKRNKGILEDMDKKVTSAITMFHLRGQATVEIAVSEVTRRVKDVHNTILTADEERLITSIPHALAGYYSVDELKSGFLEGTREELFEDLETWARRQLGSASRAILQQLYLLSGGAGLGKSSVAHQLCVRIAESWGLNLGASFFFVRGGGALESARSLFSTIAHQLARSQPTLRPYIAEAVSDFLRNGEEQQMTKTFRILLWGPLTKFAASGVHQPNTFVVIDGLDECKDRLLVPELLQCLVKLVRAFPWLYIFVGTRPEPHILPTLTSANSASVVYHRSLNDTVIEWKEDVAKYIRATVPMLRSCREYVRDNPDYLGRLISRANGVFIYARVAVNVLETFDDHPEELFALLLGSQDSKLPPLDDLYLQVLRLAFPLEYLDVLPGRVDRLRAVLTFLALRMNDLSPEAIALLLGHSEDDVVRVVDRLRSVLLVDEKGKVVPLHATFGEFLVDPNRCIDASFHINRADGHSLLLSRCIASFSFENAQAFLASARDGVYDGPVKYMFYTKHWDLHLQNAKYNAELGQQLQDFLRLQLPIFSRLHGKRDRRRLLAAFFEPLENSSAICVEYSKFYDYCFCWWCARLQQDYKVNPRAVYTSTGITNNPYRVCEYLNDELRGVEITVSPGDLVRYEAVVEDLYMKIREAKSEALWYNSALETGMDVDFEGTR